MSGPAPTVPLGVLPRPPVGEVAVAVALELVPAVVTALGVCVGERASLQPRPGRGIHPWALPWPPLKAPLGLVTKWGHPAPCTSPPCPKGGCLTFLTQAAPVAGEAEADEGVDLVDAGAAILAGAGQAIVHVCGVQGTGQTAGPHGTRKPAQDRTALQEDCMDTVGLTGPGVGELSLPYR